MPVNPLTMGVTMLGTADVVMLAGGELRPAEKKVHCYWIMTTPLTWLYMLLMLQNSYNVLRHKQVYTETFSPIVYTCTHPCISRYTLTQTEKVHDQKLHCISSLMQGHGCDVSLSHIRRLSWHILQDSWGVNLWKMSLSVVFARYPAGSYCSRWWNHYATSERKKKKKIWSR